MTWQLPDTHWLNKIGRFLNVMDPEINILSPVRIQAWGTTVGALYTTLSADFSHIAGAAQSGVMVVYAGLAHLIHAKDKQEHNAQEIRRVQVGDPK